LDAIQESENTVLIKNMTGYIIHKILNNPGGLNEEKNAFVINCFCNLCNTVCFMFKIKSGIIPGACGNANA